MQHSTPRCSVQPTCYYCRSTGLFKFNCPKLITATASKTPQKPVALIVPGQDQQSDEIQAVFGREGGMALMAAPSSVVTSSSPVRSELDWCHPLLCQGTVEIAEVTYPFTVLIASSTAVAVKECDWEASWLRSACVVQGNWCRGVLRHGGD